MTISFNAAFDENKATPPYPTSSSELSSIYELVRVIQLRKINKRPYLTNEDSTAGTADRNLPS